MRRELSRRATGSYNIKHRCANEDPTCNCKTHRCRPTTCPRLRNSGVRGNSTDNADKRAPT
eukprot:10631208-Lingulodinium_polyedra.AAC.1